MMMDNGVLSDLISNSCEVSASSSLSGSRSNNNNNSNNSNVVSGTRSSFCSQQANQPFASATQGLAPPRKRAHPDPDAEVIALSPKSLLAKNRFVCEICKKGFQRDQNLQLHRRGHNLPWKLKQRADKELVRKKVYICPEPTCAHHDPSRALGDLTGIKKHFCRKHGEKKWKCEKCTKCYAVQADWKAHSKICGTREYRCDCGTLFSRRDSFITHRAFCNAMARVSSLSWSMPSQKNRPDNSPVCHLSTSSNNNPQPHALSIKKEQENLHHHHHPSSIPTEELLCSASAYLEPSPIHRTNPSPMLLRSTITAGTSSHMSATALLQRAAQMGVTMSKPSPSLTDLVMPHPQASPYAHHHTPETGASIAGSAGPVLSSGGEDHMMAAAGGSFFFLQGLDSFGTDEYLGVSSAAAGENALVSASTVGEVRVPPRNTVSSPGAGLLGSSYLNSSFSQEAPTGGIIRTNTSEDNHHYNSDLREKSTDPHAQTRGRSDPQGTTRDFLGLRAFSTVQEGLVDVAGFDLMGSHSSSMNDYKDTSDEVQNEDQYRSLWQH